MATDQLDSRHFAKPMAYMFSRRSFLRSLVCVSASAASPAIALTSAQLVLAQAVQYFNCGPWFSYQALLDPDVSVHQVHSFHAVFKGPAAFAELQGLVGACLFVPYGVQTTSGPHKVSGSAYWKDSDGSVSDDLHYVFEIKNNLITKMTTSTNGNVVDPKYACAKTPL